MERNKYRYELYKLCAIKNSISLICFTILALVFQKWWIVFFSGLFLTSVKDKKEE